MRGTARAISLTRANAKQPDIEEAPEKGGLANRGFRGLGPCVEGYGLRAAIVLQPHGHAMGIQWTTPKISAGCDLGATLALTPANEVALAQNAPVSCGAVPACRSRPF